MFDDTPVAASITSSWSRDSHLIQTGRVAIGRSRARATAPSDRFIRPAVTSSQESIASPGTGATRSASLRPVATVLRSTTSTSRGGATCRYSFDHCFCGQIVRKANDVVKQSVHSCQSSLHLDNRSRPTRLGTTPTHPVPGGVGVRLRGGQPGRRFRARPVPPAPVRLADRRRRRRPAAARWPGR
jgi:hypothetical protein